MTKIRRREVTIERHEITIFRRAGRSITAFCSLCKAETFAIRIEQIGALQGIGETEIAAIAATGRIHFIETSGGRSQFVCGKSLVSETEIMT